MEFDQKYLILDSETRNLNGLIANNPVKDANQCWDLSWLEAKGNFIIAEHENFIDVPNLQLSDLVAKLTHFDRAKYNRLKKQPETVWAALKKFLYNEEYMIVGQNIINFDVYIIGILAKTVGENIDWSFTERILDTRALAIAYKNNIERPRDGRLYNWQHKILNDRTLKGKASQSALLKEFGIQSVNEDARHSGLVDCKDTFAIFKELKKRMGL